MQEDVLTNIRMRASRRLAMGATVAVPIGMITVTRAQAQGIESTGRDYNAGRVNTSAIASGSATASAHATAQTASAWPVPR